MRNSIIISSIIISVTCAFLLIITSRANVYSDEDAKKLFNSLGYEIQIPADEIKEMKFPEEMDNIYEGYNSIQKKAGYDITPYLGKTVIRRTYIITNYTEDKQIGIIGNLFIYNNKVIAGDVTNVALNGFMHPLIPR